MSKTLVSSIVLPLLLFSALPSVSASANALPPINSPLNALMGPEAMCVPAFVLAILTEGAVVLIGGRVRKKPPRRLLQACTLANVITVTALSRHSTQLGGSTVFQPRHESRQPGCGVWSGGAVIKLAALLDKRPSHV